MLKQNPISASAPPHILPEELTSLPCPLADFGERGGKRAVISNRKENTGKREK